MSRLAEKFGKWKQAGHKALIPYVVAGDPHPEMTVPLMHAMVEAGADIIELGVPFSDPMADGPVIALGHERALQHGVSLRDVLTMVRQFRERDTSTPIVLMGYLNPVEAMGYATFAQLAASSAVDAVLIVDMPPEEAGELLSELASAQVDPVFLLAPTTTMERARKIVANARGYLYYVSLKGVTGSAALDVDEVQHRVEQLRTLTTLPVAVGFGIRDAATARRVSRCAEAVVVGSILVQLLADSLSAPAQGVEAVVNLLRSMRMAMDQEDRPE